MKGKRILVGIGIFLVVIIAGYFWIVNKLTKIQENKELSLQIPESIKLMFEETNIDDYRYLPQDIDWQNRYLLLDLTGDLIYNKERNEKLGTAKYFPNEKINGLVIIKHETKTIGYYKKDKNDSDISSQRAYQHYYAVSFFDLSKRIVVAQDTIWGEEPKERKRSGENQHGIIPTSELPDENKLITVIKSRIK